MNLDQFTLKTQEKSIEKYVFAQGNKPCVHYSSGGCEFLSEVVLEEDEVLSLIKDLGGKIDSHQPIFDFVTYREGVRFDVSVIRLQDHVSMEIVVKEQKTLGLEELGAPGFLHDWSQVSSGVLFFYGPESSLLDEVQLSFCKKRVEKTQGSSLLFTKSSFRFVGNEKHSVSFSQDELSFLESKKSGHMFSTYLFQSSFSDLDPKTVFSFANRPSLVLLRTPWSSLKQVFLEMHHWAGERFSSLCAEQAVGFVGAQSIVSREGRVPFYEVLPFDMKIPFLEERKGQLKGALKTHGITFNQSLMSLVLKRRVALEEAYKMSSDPEELNVMLAQAGV